MIEDLGGDGYSRYRLYARSTKYRASSNLWPVAECYASGFTRALETFSQHPSLFKDTPDGALVIVLNVSGPGSGARVYEYGAPSAPTFDDVTVTP